MVNYVILLPLKHTYAKLGFEVKVPHSKESLPIIPTPLTHFLLPLLQLQSHSLEHLSPVQNWNYSSTLHEDLTSA